MRTLALSHGPAQASRTAPRASSLTVASLLLMRDARHRRRGQRTAAARRAPAAAAVAARSRHARRVAQPP
eukprot:3226523-Prymnesium_polylepis.1